MQDSFTSPDGFVSVSYPDVLVPRPKMPQVMERTQFIALLPFSDILMGWQGNYPSIPAVKRPVHPNWIGTMSGPLIYPAAAPISWMPTLLGFLAVPRLHRTHYAYKADPLSGYDLDVAQKMAWDYKPQGRIFLRPKRAATQEALVIPLSVIAAGEDCVELVDVDFTVTTLLATAVTVTDLIDEALTTPDLVTEDLC